MNIEGLALFCALMGLYLGWGLPTVLIYLAVKSRLLAWSWNATLATMLTTGLFASIAGLFFLRAQSDGNHTVMLFCAMAFGYLVGIVLELAYETYLAVRGNGDED